MNRIGYYRPSLMVNGVASYLCTHCQTVKAADEFRPLSWNSGSKCGLSSWCKTCEHARRGELRKARKTA